MPNFAIAYYTDTGSTHAVNQDSICIKTVRNGDVEFVVAGLFDGMGGLSEGERVSGAGAKALSDWIGQNKEVILSGNIEKIKLSLTNMLDGLNEKVCAFGKRQGVETGTTAAILLAGQGRYISCNVGDSRVYILRANEVRQISEDHNLAASLISAGLLTKESAKAYAQKNVLTQAVGILEKITPYFHVGTYETDSSFLLCCDGFYNLMTEKELSNLSAVPPGREAMTAALISAAKTVILRGETDNITGILIRNLE